VTLHGHAHPAIAAAIAEQATRLEQVIFAGFTHEPAVRLAEALVRIAPVGLERTFLSDNGSTAVEVALKMALQYWSNGGEERNIVVALDHAYHGDTFGAMSASARGLFTAPFTRQMFDVARLPDPATEDVVAPFQRLCEERGREIAALIVEPMLLGAGGMRMWTADALRQLRRITREHGILLIADEVLTGFGRTGPLFACEHAGVAPDIMCLSKGITGGFLPLGATLATDEIFARFLSPDRSRTLFHGHSYTANPLACAAAVASAGLLDESCATSREDIERSHRRWIATLTDPRVRNARVLGTVCAFDLGEGDGYLEPVGPALARHALRMGVLLRPLGNTVYILPPYCITQNELGQVYAAIEDSIISTCPARRVSLMPAGSISSLFICKTIAF
jgi:adenosylmethionine-8-amino-7-oxononanoate aminotransferase